MSRRRAPLEAVLGLAVALLAATACSAAVAADAPPRHCALLAGEYETQGQVNADVMSGLRMNTRIAQSRLLQRMQADRLVANTFFVDYDDHATTAAKVRKMRAITGCDTVVEIRSVFWASAIGSAFGYDVVVDRATPGGDASTQVYSHQYRYGLDKATLGNFSHDGFAAMAWDDLRQAAVLDVDREAAAIDASVTRAEYDRLATAWPQNLPEYHLRHILRESELLGIAMIARLHDQNPPDFAVLAAGSSDDASSAARGGDIGWVTLANLPPEIARAVRTQGHPGLVDHPIHADDGWHVIELLGERVSHPPPFADVQSRLAAKLRWDAVVPAAVWVEAQRP